MASVKTFIHALSGGEVSPELYARPDVSHVAQSIALARNFETLPHGPARNRTGFEFVKEVRTSSKLTRLIPFSFNARQTFTIEIGAGYFRWHTLAETLLAGTVAAWSNATAYDIGDMALQGGIVYYCILAHTNHVPPNGTYWYAMPADGTYEIPNPYAEADLRDIHYTQSADVLTLVHPSYAVRELRRYGATNWQLSTVGFQPQIAAPTGVTATATGSGTTTYTYVATAVSGANNLEESVASSSNSCTNDLTTGTNHNTLTCTAPSGALRINWYKGAGGLFGYIGQAAPGSPFIDSNITADVARTPPLFDATFDVGSGNHPGAVGYFEQRRVFGGWNNVPQSVLATRSGTETNIGYHIPTQADDRIAFRIAARQGSQIHHIVPVHDLVLLTGTNVFRIFGGDGGPLTGANINVRPQGVGSNNVQPVTFDDTTVIYAQAVGGRMRELAFSTTAQGSYYQSNDLSELAPHLFDGYEIVDMAFTIAPYPMLWAVNDQGTLLGMTYVPSQQICAWHHHDTDGAFESCCVITEEGEDFLYVIVRRTIGGATKRYVERRHSRKMATQADAFFVDAGLTYTGAPTTRITGGLDHLEGKTVSILADGAVMPQQVVTAGALPDDFPVAASTIQVGLPYTADLQTLPLTVALPDGGQGSNKNLNQVWLRLKDSSGIFVGPSFERLTPFKQRTDEPYGAPPNWAEGWKNIVPLGSWGPDGQVCIRQTDPLPLTIVACKLEVSIGG